MESDSIIAPTFKPKFMAEYSMGQFDYVRIDKTLTEIDLLSAMITSTAVPSLDLIQRYFAHLKNLYDNFRPIISFKYVTEQLDDVVARAKRMKRVWESCQKVNMPMSQKQIFELVDLLDNFKTKLYDLKQVIGLGIVVKRNLTTKEKIRQGIRGDTDFSNLPEQ